jgi:hypothetical protein
MAYLRLILVLDHYGIVVCRQLEVLSEVRRWSMNTSMESFGPYQPTNHAVLNRMTNPSIYKPGPLSTNLERRIFTLPGVQ